VTWVLLPSNQHRTDPANFPELYQPFLPKVIKNSTKMQLYEPMIL
jgi:hypothetical protein